MSSDNTSPGALAEYQVTLNFVNSVNVVAVHSRDWATYKYAQLTITYKGRTGVFIVADYCSDKDCGGCCTANANYKGNGFLTDVDSTAARRVFGVSKAEDFLYDSATFTLGSKVDFAAMVRKYR
jgi:hypothetical protein